MLHKINLPVYLSSEGERKYTIFSIVYHAVNNFLIFRMNFKYSKELSYK